MKIDPLQGMSSKCVAASELAIGEPYFIVNHLADSIPVITSVIYLGKDFNGEDTEEFWFQDAESYKNDGPYPENDDAAEVIATGPALPPNIFGFEGLIDELNRLTRLRQSMQRNFGEDGKPDSPRRPGASRLLQARRKTD